MALDGGVLVGVVGGRYRLVRVVGTGGMGRVWQARDEVLARDVAVKEMLPLDGVQTGRVDLWERSIREARSAARLNNPHVVQIFDVLLTAGRPWIVMEYVAGRSLDAAVVEDGPLDEANAARIGLAILEGLDAAHRVGVLHRDVKPHNVLLAESGRVLLSDFGLAVFGEEASGTGAGRDDLLIGSPAYMAPERVADGTSSARTDLWSLGATLYWAVEGRPPYTRGTTMEQLAALATESPDPTSRAVLLRPVIDGLLRRDPDERLAAPAVRHLLTTALARALEPVRVSMSTPDILRSRRQVRRRKLLLAAVSAAVVATTGAIAYATTSQSVPRSTFVAIAASPTPSTPRCDPLAPAPATAVPTGQPLTDAVGPSTLPAGWTWYVDERFTVAVPKGWLRYTENGLVCLVDPAGGRAITVDVDPPVPLDRVAHWQREEQTALADGVPPGYRKITISPALYQRGGADWEFSYDENGARWHTLRRSFAVEAGRGFVMSWTTPEAAWETEQPTFRTVAQSFNAR